MLGAHTLLVNSDARIAESVDVLTWWAMCTSPFLDEIRNLPQIFY